MGLGHYYSTLLPNNLKYHSGSLSSFHVLTSNNLKHCLCATWSCEIKIHKRRHSRKHIALLFWGTPRRLLIGWFCRLGWVMTLYFWEGLPQCKYISWIESYVSPLSSKGKLSLLLRDHISHTKELKTGQISFDEKSHQNILGTWSDAHGKTK